jgi:hypothetical protein
MITADESGGVRRAPPHRRHEASPNLRHASLRRLRRGVDRPQPQDLSAPGESSASAPQGLMPRDTREAAAARAS